MKIAFYSKVVGLAENRPSLLKGDRIFVTWTGATSKYCGYVHRVEKENVLLKFHQRFGLNMNVHVHCMKP